MEKDRPCCEVRGGAAKPAAALVAIRKAGEKPNYCRSLRTIGLYGWQPYTRCTDDQESARVNTLRAASEKRGRSLTLSYEEEFEEALDEGSCRSSEVSRKVFTSMQAFR